MKALRPSLSFFLALLMLVGGSGMVIGKMICLHSGEVFFSLSAARDCCPPPANEHAIKAKCCELSNIALQTGKYIASAPQNLVPVSTYTPAFYGNASHHRMNFPAHGAVFHVTDPSPPCASDYRTRIAVFRI